MNGQNLFYCDTTVIDKKVIYSSCDHFFNFFENSVDSFLVPAGYEYDTLLEVDMPIYKNEFITIFVHPICKGCDSLEVVYFYRGTPFLKGRLLNGKAEGPFEWNFSDNLIQAIFHNGKLHGQKTKLHNSKKFVENYVDGILNGNVYELDADGKYLYFCNYEDGAKEGMEYGLHDNGMLNFVNYYDAGVLKNGIYYKYDGEGKVYLQITVKEGKVVEEDWKND